MIETIEEAICLVNESNPELSLLTVRELADKYVFEVDSREDNLFFRISMIRFVSVNRENGDVENFLPELDERFYSAKEILLRGKSK